MAYYLRKEKKKKGIYLQMYESHWTKKRNSHVQKVSWLLDMCRILSPTKSPILSLITQTL